ncbi:MAG: acyl-CoA thioesterase [Sphingomonadaceae bacterium]
MIPFARQFIAHPHDIDELGHVNNAVWVRWIQDMATAHWSAAATADHAAAYVWVVVRHEIDYRGNLMEGECVTATTWVANSPQGAKWDRFVEFRKDGRLVVQAKTSWAILDRASGRLIRVPKDVVGRFA